MVRYAQQTLSWMHMEQFCIRRVNSTSCWQQLGCKAEQAQIQGCCRLKCLTFGVPDWNLWLEWRYGYDRQLAGSYAVSKNHESPPSSSSDHPRFESIPPAQFSPRSGALVQPGRLEPRDPKDPRAARETGLCHSQGEDVEPCWTMLNPWSAEFQDEPWSCGLPMNNKREYSEYTLWWIFMEGFPSTGVAGLGFAF